MLIIIKQKMSSILEPNDIFCPHKQEVEGEVTGSVT